MSELALKLIAENKAKHARGEDARVLVLGHCGLLEVPEEVEDLVWLTQLDLTSPNLSYFDDYPRSSNDIVSLVGVENLVNLQSLKCSKNEISDLSPLLNLINLQSLDCSSTRVSDLSILSNLTNLQSLHCSSTQVSDLSPLSNLTNLQSLHCSSTQVSDLSPLSNLTNLQSLHCSSTQVSDLSLLSNLKEIICEKCNISDLEFILNFNNLTTLLISDNNVSVIKKNVYQFIYSKTKNWYNLSRPIIEDKNSAVRNQRYETAAELRDREVKIQSGSIQDEDSIFSLEKEWLLFVFRGNPLISPPLEIIQQGNAAILQYFAEQEKQQFKNTETKLILVGNSTAGKTSLSQYLQNRTFTKAQSTTHGIQNQQWQPKDREIQVNIWDFGGQEYYHATHRLFLSRNAVYALVWDAQTDKGGVEPTEIYYHNDTQPCIVDVEHFPQKWWLQNIRHYTRESNPPVPILMVQNKSERDQEGEVSNDFGKSPFLINPADRNNHIDIAAAADPKHPQHKKWLRQFETFEDRLLDKLQSQLANYEFAVYHRDIRDKVRELAAEGVNDMSYSDFEQLCHNIEADASMDLVQIYLRDITGDILYYPDNKRLRKRVFLRPDWVCKQIYTILSRKVLDKQGFFDLEWVRESIGGSAGHAYATTTAEDFVELMREFELVFPESDDNGHPTGQLVAPQYLPDTCTKPDKLEAAKEYASLSHAFTLWFPEFFPKSHIARFVAHWGSQAKQRLFWKNGLLFQTEGCTALVERIGEDKIRVELQNGEKIKRQAAILRIFQSFLKLEDGQGGFAFSLDALTFVWWRDVLDATQMQARQVKPFYPEGTKPILIQVFTTFQNSEKKMKKVFISYSKSDKSYLEDFKVQLSSLSRQNLLETWDDTNLIPGQEWDSAIRNELKLADIIVLLVSSNLIATDYIWNIEMKEALARHERGEVLVIPVIIRPCVWEDAPFGKLNALPEKGKPIDRWENKDEAWAQVVKKIKTVL